ncbi:hypothetical protein GCM10009813_30970 [Brevibacterium marinum]
MGASGGGQQRVDLGEDASPSQAHVDVGWLTHGHTDAGNQHDLFWKSQLGHHSGRMGPRAGKLYEVPTSRDEVIDESLCDRGIDPMPPLKCAETHIADFKTGAAEALLLHGC